MEIITISAAAAIRSNCNHPIVQQMILECLRYWTITLPCGRLPLRSGQHPWAKRRRRAPMNNPPLLEMHLPMIRSSDNVKLIAEAWDAGGLYQVGSFPANGTAGQSGTAGIVTALRSFLKGDFWQSWDAAWSISGSGDLYGGYYSHSAGNYAGYNSCVNFLTCHDGFTLYDLYAYNEKHNECNGWNNTDGCQ